jgi:hypothetical protein
MEESMPSIQVRDVPEEVFRGLSMVADEENRSIAQQTVVLLKEGLGLHVNGKLRRKAFLESLSQSDFPASGNADTVAMLREDRER